MSKRVNETIEIIKYVQPEGKAPDFPIFEISKWSWTGMHKKILGESLPGVEFWRIQDPTLGVIHLRLIGYRWIAARGWGAEIDQILERHEHESKSKEADSKDQSVNEVASKR